MTTMCVINQIHTGMYSNTKLEVKIYKKMCYKKFAFIFLFQTFLSPINKNNALGKCCKGITTLTAFP